METHINEKRFSGIIGGSEYELLLKSMPHYRDVQQMVGDIVAMRFKGSQVAIIKVLEAGCGTGFTTEQLLMCDDRTEIWTVDNEKKMIEETRRKVDAAGLSSRLHFTHDDILVFLATVPDGYFDIFASAWVLHNFEDGFRKEVMKEVYRVLRPGGLFINGDKYAQDNLTLRARALESQLRRFEVYDGMGRSDYKAEWIAHYKQDERPEVIWVEGLAKKDMSDLGFVEIAMPYRFDMEAVIVATKPESAA